MSEVSVELEEAETVEEAVEAAEAAAQEDAEVSSDE